MMKPDLFQAVLALVGGSLSYDATSDSFTYHDDQTPPTEAEAEAKLAELNSAWEAQEYSRNRAEAYDSVGNQLDMLMKDMKNNTTTHQESCEAVKARFPKP